MDGFRSRNGKLKDTTVDLARVTENLFDLFLIEAEIRGGSSRGT